MSENIYNCGGRLRELCKNIETWRIGKGFATHWHNTGEKLMLIVTEVSEAYEAFRHIPQDIIDTLQNQQEPVGAAHRGALCRADLPAEVQTQYEPVVANFKEELADIFIRLADLASSLDIDLEEEVMKKMQTNEGRPWRHGKER